MLHITYTRGYYTDNNNYVTTYLEVCTATAWQRDEMFNYYHVHEHRTGSCLEAENFFGSLSEFRIVLLLITIPREMLLPMCVFVYVCVFTAHMQVADTVVTKTRYKFQRNRRTGKMYYLSVIKFNTFYLPGDTLHTHPAEKSRRNKAYTCKRSENFYSSIQLHWNAVQGGMFTTSIRTYNIAYSNPISSILLSNVIVSLYV